MGSYFTIMHPTKLPDTKCHLATQSVT